MTLPKNIHQQQTTGREQRQRRRRRRQLTSFIHSKYPKYVIFFLSSIVLVTIMGFILFMVSWSSSTGIFHQNHDIPANQQRKTLVPGSESGSASQDILLLTTKKQQERQQQQKHDDTIENKNNVRYREGNRLRQQQQQDDYKDQQKSDKPKTGQRQQQQQGHQSHHNRHHKHKVLKKPTTQQKQPQQLDRRRDTKFLIFRPPLEATQGLGNIMNGLLAAHALGMEYDRVVCVSPEWLDFYQAFESLDSRCLQKNSDMYHNYQQHADDGQQKNQFIWWKEPRTSFNTLWLINFGKLPINECQLQDRLASSESIIFLIANTYPRWPSAKVPPASHFESFYKPTDKLMKVIPWKSSQSPRIVVHLRQPDDAMKDKRAGLDTDTLRELGTALPSGTFLVTNQVAYYKYFESHFGWSHPHWQGIQHSANANVRWNKLPSSNVATHKHEQVMAMWSDWWTLYHAEQTYHTESDFSMSAARWSGGESYSIQGVDVTAKRTNEKLQLIPASWQEMPIDATTTIRLLSQRSEGKLLHCNLHPSGIDGIGYVLDLDDEFHDDTLLEV